MSYSADPALNEAWVAYAWRRWLLGYYRGGAIVDAACGLGVKGSVLLRCGARRVIGLDLDLGCLHEARERGLCVVRVNLAEKIALRAGVADLVLLIHAIEHFDDGSGLLRRLSDILRPGGAIVVVTPDWAKNKTGFYDDPTHRRPYTKIALEAVLRESSPFLVEIAERLLT